MLSKLANEVKNTQKKEGMMKRISMAASLIALVSSMYSMSMEQKSLLKFKVDEKLAIVSVVAQNTQFADPDKVF